MKKISKIFIFLGGLVLFFGMPSSALAAPESCFCYSNIAGQNSLFLFKNQASITSAKCLKVEPSACSIKAQASVFKNNSIAPTCDLIVPTPTMTGEEFCKKYLDDWNKLKVVLLAEGANSSQNATTQSSGGSSVLSTLITQCSKGDWKSLPAECKDVTVFVKLALQIVNYLFAIIGALALAVFVYGGFVLILSAGSEEKVKQGTGAMVNAVIGILVAFSGYVLVSFLGDVLNLKSEFSLFF